jgi:hypothetical protein
MARSTGWKTVVRRMTASADISSLIAGMGRYRDVAVAAAKKAVGHFAQDTLDKAQEICPVETGFLQASATASPVVEEGGQVKRTIGFNAAYAAARHERPPEHDAPPRQNSRGQWKFLETAVREAVPKFGPYVAAKVKAAVSSAGGGTT